MAGTALILGTSSSPGEQMEALSIKPFRWRLWFWRNADVGNLPQTALRLAEGAVVDRRFAGVDCRCDQVAVRRCRAPMNPATRKRCRCTERQEIESTARSKVEYGYAVMRRHIDTRLVDSSWRVVYLPLFGARAWCGLLFKKAEEEDLGCIADWSWLRVPRLNV